MPKIVVPAYLRGLVPYRAGRAIAAVAREKGLKKIVKLASNENPLPPPKSFLKEVAKAYATINRYPEPSSHLLTSEIAKRLGISPHEVICGNGSDSLLFFSFLVFGGNGAEVVTSEGTFVSAYLHTQKLNQKLITVPMKNYTFDLDAIAAGITPKTKIVYLANPNNPTATFFDRESFSAFLDKVPDHVLVIYDEAYQVYASLHETYPDGMNFRRDNVLILRTFSKAQGLAGERIGYAIAHPDLIADLYRVRFPFEPGSIAQVLALAALRDRVFVKRTQKLNERSLNLLMAEFRRLNLKFTTSGANFTMLIFKDEKEATRFNEACLNRGLILRPLQAFHIPEGVRINSGTMEETKFAIEVIREVVGEMRGESVVEKKQRRKM